MGFSVKGYFVIDSVKYYCVDTYCIQRYGLIENPKNTNCFLSYNAAYNYNELLDYKPLSPLEFGTNVYVAPDCDLAIDDIRSSYTVKRNLESADAVIASKLSTQKTKWWSLIVFPEIRIAVITSIYSRINIDFIFENLKKVGYNLNQNTLRTRQVDLRGAYYSDPQGVIEGRLNNTIQKPIYLTDNLSLKRSNTITPDVLFVTYNALSKGFYDDNSKENMILSLQALNQYNYKDYPGTINMLFDIASNKNTIYKYYRNHGHSSLPKTVRNLIEYGKTCCAEFKSEEDYNLGKALIDSILNINGNQVFSTMISIRTQCEKSGIPINLFERFYNNIVRITPKRFEGKNAS